MTSRGRVRWLLVLLIVAAGALYLVGNESVSLWDRDEPRYAQTSRQMLERAERGEPDAWIVPKLQNEDRLKKPVLIYWVQAEAMRVFGKTVFAARFPSSVSILATIALLGVVLYRTVGPRRALWTAFVFATSGLVIFAAKMCITDAVLLLFITAAQLCLYAIWRGRGSWAVMVALGLSIGLAGLTKGPIVLGVMGTTLLVLFAFRLYDRKVGETTLALALPVADRSVPRVILKTLLVILVAAAVLAPWLYAIEKARPGWIVGTFTKEVVKRSKDAQEGHKGPPGYYLLTIWGTFFPWSLLLPATMVIAWRNRRLPTVRFALAAVVGPWIMLELVATKLPHYFLPTFPPLAYLTAEMLIRAGRRHFNDLTQRPFVVAVFCWWILVTAIGLAPWASLLFFRPPGVAELLALLTFSIVSFTFGFYVYCFFKAHAPLDAAAVMGVGMMALMAILFAWYLPAASYMHLSRRVARVLVDQTATYPGDAMMIDYKEKSLAFYQGGTILEQSDDRFLEHNPPQFWPRWLVVTKPVWDNVPEPIRAQWTSITPTPIRGWNYADEGRIAEVLVVRRK